MRPAIVQHLLVAVVGDVLVLALKTVEFEVSHGLRRGAARVNHRSVHLFFAADLLRDGGALLHPVLFVAVVNLPLVHLHPEFELGRVVAELLHPVQIVFVAPQHQLPKDALIGFVPRPSSLLLLGEHLCIPRPESVLAELKVVFLNGVGFTLHPGRFESHVGGLFAVVVSVVVDVPFLGVLQVALFDLLLEAFPFVLVLVAVHDFFQFVSAHIRELLDAEHLLRIG